MPGTSTSAMRSHQARRHFPTNSALPEIKLIGLPIRSSTISSLRASTSADPRRRRRKGNPAPTDRATAVSDAADSHRDTTRQGWCRYPQSSKRRYQGTIIARNNRSIAFNVITCASSAWCHRSSTRICAERSIDSSAIDVTEQGLPRSHLSLQLARCCW